MFQKSIVEKYLSKIDSKLLTEKYNQFCSIFQNEKKIENIRNSKEEQYQEGFIRDLFCSILGYTIKPEENYNILTELKNEVANKSNSKKSDGAICEENNENKIRAVIELKGTDTTDLDKVAFQAFSYKNFHNECNYVIVSNFERLRIYVETQIEYEEFNLFKLSYERFCLLYLLLELNQLKADVPLKLKHETLSEEKQITDNFYADYSTFKRLLFEDMIENNPEVDKLVLFKKTQKLLDRILFILFCEDRNLLPANSIANIVQSWEKSRTDMFSVASPLYDYFKRFFMLIDKGYDNPNDKASSIFAYNGGLFKSDEVLASIKVGDDVLFIHTKRLADYDFESQVSVDILGRIFENSLTEIEEVQKQIAEEKAGAKIESNNVGKRKKDGVFYTPEYITRYIVENTIGKLCEEKRRELKINDEEYNSHEKYTKVKATELEKRLEEYRNWLLQLKILDPACGSGAFLNAALHQLKVEHTLIDYYWSAIRNGELNFYEIENVILENNLYGVDINEDSIEITKLSLWLHTAKKNRKLTTLNGKIKCGNSLIDDPAVAGEKAFNWQKEFPEVFEKGGFDVVIGNPPYGAKIGKKEIEYLVKNLSNSGISNLLNDTYFCFYVIGLSRLVKRNGLLGYITPNTWKLIESAQNFRTYLLKTDFCIKEIVQHTNKVFKDATVDCDTLIIQKNKPLKNDIKISFMNEDSILKNHYVVQDKLSSQLFINLFLKEEDYLLKDKILSNSVLLKDVLIIKNGVKPYEKGKGKPAQTSETLKEKPYTSEIKKDETFSPLIGGSLFNKYKLLWDNNYWIKYGDWLAAPREKEIFECSEKLIFRQTSDSLIGTYIGFRFYNAK